MMYATSLDAEELELLRSVENDEWQPIPQMEQAIQRYQQIAAAARRESDVTIRLPQQDLGLLQTKAREIGISYQALIVRLVQNFVASEGQAIAQM